MAKSKGNREKIKLVSSADERITRRLQSALALVDIRLLDHLIIGHGAATSLAGRGLL